MTIWCVSELAQKLVIKCRFKAGSSVDLEVLDISPGGCMVDCRRWSANAGDRALIKLPGLAFQPVEIVWVEDQKAGFAFEQPLHEAVMENIWQKLSAPQAA